MKIRSGVEIERDIKIEIIDESDGIIRESPYSLGFGRCAVEMPRYTEEELKIGLGDTYDLIERTFANLDAN